MSGLRATDRLRAFLRDPANLPYVILGFLAGVSLVARLLLILV